MSKGGLKKDIGDTIRALTTWLWRNPTYMCDKCLNYNLKHTKYYRQYESGFNKYHLIGAHKKGIHMADYQTCEPCKTIANDYDLDDLHLTGSIEKHYEVNKGAKRKVDKKVATATKAFTPGQWYWHVHHEKLVEQLTEPVENRINYIKADKGAQVATRLHFMRPVKNPPVAVNPVLTKAETLFNTVDRAHRNYTVTDAVLEAARENLRKARLTYGTNQTPTQAQWEALHKQECYSYCPWNGKTLFPPRTHGIA